MLSVHSFPIILEESQGTFLYEYHKIVCVHLKWLTIERNAIQKRLVATYPSLLCKNAIKSHAYLLGRLCETGGYLSQRNLLSRCAYDVSIKMTIQFILECIMGFVHTLSKNKLFIFKCFLIYFKYTYFLLHRILNMSRITKRMYVHRILFYNFIIVHGLIIISFNKGYY